jgi:hypothetical protein
MLLLLGGGGLLLVHSKLYYVPVDDGWDEVLVRNVLHYVPVLHYVLDRQNIIILFWKYLVDIRSEAWLNLIWEYINGKLFAV